MKERLTDINALPGLVKSGRISSKQALGMLAEMIQENPYFFRLVSYDEDTRSDLILSVLQNGRFVFDRYNPQFGEFRTYFMSFLRGQLLTLSRRNAARFYSSMSLDQELPSEYERSAEMYARDEFPLAEARFTPCDPPPAAGAPYRIAPVPENRRAAGNAEFAGRWRKNRSASAKTALVLALKSSFYLTDRHIDEVSRRFGIDSDNLHRTVEDIKSTLRKRTEKFTSLKERRDKAYYLHKKYRFQLQYCRQETIQKNRIRELYEKQTRNWKRKNEILQQKSYRVCPTNREIAGLLGICERQVSYYIRKGKEMGNDGEKEADNRRAPEAAGGRAADFPLE